MEITPTFCFSPHSSLLWLYLIRMVIKSLCWCSYSSRVWGLCNVIVVDYFKMILKKFVNTVFMLGRLCTIINLFYSSHYISRLTCSAHSSRSPIISAHGNGIPPTRDRGKLSTSLIQWFSCQPLYRDFKEHSMPFLFWFHKSSVC
jgi:hypothetical protein